MWLNERVPNSSLDVPGPGAGHYVFLPEPTVLGSAIAPDVFVDRSGVSRAAIHTTVASDAVQFFKGAWVHLDMGQDDRDDEATWTGTGPNCRQGDGS